MLFIISFIYVTKTKALCALCDFNAENDGVRIGFSTIFSKPGSTCTTQHLLVFVWFEF